MSALNIFQKLKLQFLSKVLQGWGSWQANKCERNETNKYDWQQLKDGVREGNSKGGKRVSQKDFFLK